MITETEPAGVQPSQPFAESTEDFTTRLLPTSGELTALARGALPFDGIYGAQGAPNRAPGVSTSPTIADLAVLHGGPDRLLRVAEVSERLGVSTATVYKLIKCGYLPHIRIVDSIRVRPADLAKYISAEVQAHLTGRARSL